jgi:hypothetical protein
LPYNWLPKADIRPGEAKNGKINRQDKIFEKNAKNSKKMLAKIILRSIMNNRFIKVFSSYNVLV